VRYGSGRDRRFRREIARTVTASATGLLREWRNRHGPKWGLVPQAAHCQRAKKASKNNGQNFTVCCILSMFQTVLKDYQDKNPFSLRRYAEMIDETGRHVITNFKIYKAIADEAYKKMVELMEDGRRPKPDGSDGWILTYDPNHTSFKQAMISIVFTGMWLDASMHLLLVKKYGKKEVIEKKHDFKKYEEKLKLLGCTDAKLIADAERFREKIRNTLVHEEAYKNDEIRYTQDDAADAHGLLIAIRKYFAEQWPEP
jgi:hypothetical protein